MAVLCTLHIAPMIPSSRTIVSIPIYHITSVTSISINYTIVININPIVKSAC